MENAIYSLSQAILRAITPDASSQYSGHALRYTVDEFRESEQIK